MLETLKELLISYPLVAPALFIIARIVPIVFAPIPGILVDIVGIAVFGWFYGFILAEIGIILGSTSAFFIGRYFRESAVRTLASLRKVHEWEDKYSEHQKFWGLVAIRVTTSPFFDYISYAAGLTKINFVPYILSTFIGTLPLMFGIYYFGNFAIDKGILTSMAFLATLFAGALLWKFLIKKKRS